MLSHNNSINACTSCGQNLPISLFIRNQRTNTLYKTCITCRTRRNDHRQNLRRQRQVVSPPQVESNNDAGLIGKEQMVDIIDPQIVDIEMGLETNSRVTESTNLDINSNNPAINMDLMFCSKCKRNRSSDLFLGRVQGRSYKTCRDCRLRVNNRRHPQVYRAPTNLDTQLPSFDVNNMKYCTKCKKNCPLDMFTSNSANTSYTTCSGCRTLERNRRYPPLFPTRSTDLNTMYPLGREEDIYDASDIEDNNLNARISQPDNQEVVGDEVLADDEPVIILSHTDTREYAAHMRAREALPDNHDDIFDNLPEDNFDQFGVDPFEIANNNLNDQINETTINNDNNDNNTEESIPIPNDNDRNETEVENIAPRRLPQWLAPLPTHRTIPAAYTSKYNRNLPTHNLGRCTSVCPSCHALHWPQERVQSSSVARPRFQTCCKEGQVVLNEIPEPPAYLRWLWTSDDRDAKAFRKNSSAYNRSFAFTSFKYSEDRRLADRGIHGGLR
ncbi:hypothetical protein EPUL_004187, partial [Erysiphe pulchra]